jgi:hypothetical protein
MTARGPYYSALDAWVAQLVGGSTGYGNGDQAIAHIGPAPNATPGDPAFKSRTMLEFSAADVAAMLADATAVDDCTLTVTVAGNSCIGSRGSTIRIFAEELTVSFTEKAVASACSLSSVASTGTGGWHRSNNATTVNRAFHSSGSHSTGDTLTFDLSAWAAARLAAEDYSAARFRLIAANADGTGYNEETDARRISIYTRETGTAADRPQLSANITIGSVPKSLTETGTAEDAFSVEQSGTEPVLAETAVGVDAFTGGPIAGWSTGYDSNDNGRVVLYIPTAGQAAYAQLPDVAEDDIELRCKFKLNKVPLNGGAQFMLFARHSRPLTTNYRARATIGGNLHDISLIIEKMVDGSLTTLQFIGNIRTFLAGVEYWLKLKLEGSSPTTINAKIWRAGEDEPGWILQAQDSEAALQDAGAVGIGGFVTSTVTNVPITFEMDHLEGYAP